MTPASRVWIQNVTVCTFKTSPCVPARRAHVSTHVHVVAPVLSSSSSASSSSTSFPQDSSSTSLSPANLRSDDTYPQAQGNRRDNPKNKNPNQNEDIHQAAGNRLRDFPEWLEDFTENLEIAEVPASANISHDSDSERPTKVASRKHSIYTRFPKDQNCEVCKRTKMTRDGEMAKQNLVQKISVT